MSESERRLAESVSALMDGEAGELETHRVLKAMADEQIDAHSVQVAQSIRGKWSRYHLVSHSMAEAPLVYKDISSAVSNALESEQTYSKKPLYGVFDSLGRFAVAASVAMLAILGVQQVNPQNMDDIEGIKVAEMDVQGSESNQGPAIQFPADFQPNIQARTVSAGGNVKTSQRPVALIKVPDTGVNSARDQEVRSLLSEILDIHTANESDNGIQGMMPFARHINAGEVSEPE